MIKVNCFASGITFPQGEATSNRIIMLGKALIDSGVPFRVYVNSEGNRIRLNQSVSGNESGIEYTHLNGSMALDLPKWKRAYNFFVKGFLNTRKTIKKLRKEEGNYIYLYSHGSLYNVWVSYLAFRHNIPVVQEVNEWKEEVEENPMVSFIYKKVMFRWAKGALVISDNIAQKVLQHSNPKNKLKTLLLPVLADRDDWKNRDLAIQKTFVWCGLVEGYYNDVEFIIKSFARIYTDHKEYRVVICGKHKPETATKVDLLTDSLGIPRESITLTGFISNEELFQTCQSATALLSPLWDDQRSKARFPTKVASFLFSERPLLTCDIGEVGKFLTDNENALFFEPGNEKMLSEKMKSVISNDRLAKDIGQAGRALALDKFDYHSYGSRLKTFFSDIK